MATSEDFALLGIPKEKLIDTGSQLIQYKGYPRGHDPSYDSLRKAEGVLLAIKVLRERKV